jgi:hypothetical protein
MASKLEIESRDNTESGGCRTTAGHAAEGRHPRGGGGHRRCAEDGEERHGTGAAC